MKTGMVISFEGIEGSGKSTQITLLENQLIQQKHKVYTTKEPGGTSVGLQLRSMILNPNQEFGSNFTELLLFYADRLEHVKTVLEPKVNDGFIVLCDRSLDSTMAYQHAGRGVDIQLINQLNQLVNWKPQKTILLDISPEEGIQRAKKRAALDRFEQEDLSFHHRVRDQYLQISQSESDRVHRIDAENKSIPQIQESIWELVSQWINES